MDAGLTPDKASRKANILAVKTTEASYQRLVKLAKDGK